MLLYLLAQVDPGTYRQWIEDIGFIEATAALLILFIVAIGWFFIYQTHTERKCLNTKIDKLTDIIEKDIHIVIMNEIRSTSEKSVQSFNDAKEKLTAGITEMMNEIGDCNNETHSQLRELTTVVKTALNIVIKKMLNGDAKDD